MRLDFTHDVKKIGRVTKITIVKEKFQASLSRIYKYDHVNNGRKENAIAVILDLIVCEHSVNIILSIRKLIYLVSISVKMVDTGGVESGGSSNNTMNFVAFGKEKLSQVRTILTGDTSNQCTFNLKLGVKMENSLGNDFNTVLEWYFTPFMVLVRGLIAILGLR